MSPESALFPFAFLGVAAVVSAVFYWVARTVRPYVFPQSPVLVERSINRIPGQLLPSGKVEPDRVEEVTTYLVGQRGSLPASRVGNPVTAVASSSEKNRSGKNKLTIIHVTDSRSVEMPLSGAGYSVAEAWPAGYSFDSKESKRFLDETRRSLEQTSQLWNADRPPEGPRGMDLDDELIELLKDQ